MTASERIRAARERRQSEIEETITLLSDRGYATPEFCAQHSPEDVLKACEAWAKRVGIVSRGSAAVAIATGSRYPNLLDRLLPTEPRP